MNKKTIISSLIILFVAAISSYMIKDWLLFALWFVAVTITNIVDFFIFRKNKRR